MMSKNLSDAKTALLSKWLQGQLTDSTTTIPHRPLDSPTSLSFPQQRQLFLELLEPGTAVNNLSVLLDLKGRLDPAAFEQSANKIIARHDALRTCFSFRDGLPAPEILADAVINIPVVDLPGIEVDEKEIKARRLAEKEVLQPFNLAQAPLIRLKLYVVSKEYHLLLVTVHHTIADGWSLGIFLRELITFYQHFTVGKRPLLPELPVLYADFSHWQTNITRSGAFQTSVNYWKKQLSGDLPVLELPTDRQRGSRQSFSGGTHRFVLPGQLTCALDKFSQQEDVTLFMTLATAFTILLHRYSGQDEILIGVPVANRELPEIENLIGVFINTIVLRTPIADHYSFREMLKRVRDVSIEAFAHQDLPFEKLVEELNPKRDLSCTPVFQVIFNMQNSPMPTLEIPHLSIIPLEIDRGVAQFDLSLMMTRSTERWLCTVEYNADLFIPETIAKMFDSFQLLLQHVIVEPRCRISGLKMIDEVELRHLIDGRNQTQLDFPSDKCLHQLFEQQVQKTPTAVAIIYEDTELTYFELNERANRLAVHLKSLGVGPGFRAGIFMEKNLAITESLLGVHKAGGVYIPISISFPEERVKFILEDAGVQVLVTNVDIAALGDIKLPVVNLNDDNLLPIEDVPDLRTTVHSKSLAYIIYTSGSTGNPKGVMIQHSALVNFLWSMRSRPGIHKDDVLLSVTPVSFDIAALELFLPLIAGAKVVIASKEETTNPLLIDRAIQRYNVNVLQATPATWQLLIDSGWPGNPGLKALCGGDLLTRKLAHQLLTSVGSLWNMYGPTETTIWSSANQLQKEDKPITIGDPIGNTQLYILDQHNQPSPIGAVGELHIGGEGLALGYLNQIELTEAKFIKDCFSSKPGARLYKTGDLARYLTDYSIEILGRTDDQVKINGHRIELGEVATILLQHPSVHDAIVVARTEISGEKRLIAYFLAKHDQSPNTNQLQEFLRKKLPLYMIPAVFIQLNNLPLTTNGKLDRRSLPVPEDVRPLPGYIAPRNETEQFLADIWQQVLGVGQVGVRDNFFDLGGASIQSLQVVASANLAGFSLKAESIFEYQTIAELAEQVTKK